MTPDPSTVRRLVELRAAATQGDIRVRDFTQAPATEKLPAIDKCKLSPLQRTALGSFERADAEYIEFLWNHVAQGYLDAVAKCERLVQLVTHVHNEVASLEDFDADEVMRELKQALSGEKYFDDNAALEQEVARLRESRRTGGTLEICSHCERPAIEWPLCLGEDPCPIRAAQQKAAPSSEQKEQPNGSR